MTTATAAPTWRDLPKGKYLHIYTMDSGEHVGYAMCYRSVPKLLKTGRTRGRNAWIPRIKAAPGHTLDELREAITHTELERLVVEFAADPNYYRALFGQHDGHCGICGRALTDPASRDRGIGPECAAGLGIA